MTDLRYSIARNKEAPFDGNEGINPDATFGKLVETMFHNGLESCRPSFAEQVGLCVADELQLLAVVARNDAECSAIPRVALRLEWWLRIAREIEERMADIEDQVGKGEADDWELYRVPTFNNIPNFERARLANHEDFIAAGYAATSNVSDAVRILLRPSTRSIDDTEPAEVAETIEAAP